MAVYSRSFTQLNEVNALPDFLTDERFRIEFAKLPTGVNITSEDINIRTVKFTPPVTGINYITFTLHTHKKQQPAGRAVPEDFSLDLCETTDMKTYQFLHDWRELCCARNTAVVSTPEQREATILLYHLDNQNNEKYAYKFEKVMLKSFTKPEFTDGESPAVAISTLTLVCTDPLEDVNGTFNIF